jgi:hypothetical protein
MVDNTYPKITNKYKSRFGISSKLITLLHKDLYYLYSHATLKNVISPRSIHTIINNLFITEYYPQVSKNYNINNKTIPVIMGTQAINMNIMTMPETLKKELYTETDDIDLKIYTTELHYNKSKNTNAQLKNVLSLFRYIILTLLFYMKQIISEIIDYTNNIYKPTIPNYKENILKYSKKLHKTKQSHKTKHSHKTKQSHKTNIISTQKGGLTRKLITHKKTNFGVLKNINISIQIKNNSEKEIINLTKLSYDEIYKIIYEKINDIDLLITTKINYNIYYSKLLKKPKFPNPLTFSDTKIYYPNMFENPTFYAYYLSNNTQPQQTLDKLDKANININEIIKLNKCGNNCNYIALKSLQIDLILMLHYAEFINDEEYENNNIIVPMGALFKYCKYFIKYLKLNIIIKFYNKTLNKEYFNISKKLMQYLKTYLPKSDISPEITNNNINYKTLLNTFHHNFFIKKTMFPEYELLRDCVNDYNTIKLYINQSRLLFKDVYKEYNKENNIYMNNNTLLNVLHYVINKNDDSLHMNGGTVRKINKNRNKYKNIILYDNDEDNYYTDVNEDTNNNITDIFTKEIKNMRKLSSIIYKK